MIVNIPQEDAFEESGLALLNIAWDTVITLLTNIDEAPEWGVDVDEEVRNAFWGAAKRHLTTSLALAQQGIEFIIKGRISSVSPYLLIVGNPKEWPKNSQNENIDFAEFRTIDSQDLIRVHNSCSSNKFDDSFIRKYEDLRKKRNAIMHTIDLRIDIHALDIISEILSVHKSLFPNSSWIETRRGFLEESPLSELGGIDFVEQRVILEFSILTNLLTPVQTKEYFDFNKRQRRYICPECEHESSEAQIQPRTALLSPNSSNSTVLYCFVCTNEMDIVRIHCNRDQCNGNVISDEYNICCTCGSRQD